MTRRFLAALFTLLLAPVLLAQGKDMGQAQQFYQQPKTKGRFRFKPGPKTKGGDVTWTIPQGAAGHQEIVKDEYVILYPDVTFTYQDMKMHADKVTYNFKTKDVVAEGHVIIDQGPTRLTADHIVFNMESKTGTLFNATGALQPDFYFTGEKIEKTGEASYRLTNGIFTSCDIDNPSWSFHVDTADVTLDDYARMRDVVFRAHRVPLMWAPRLAWPTKRDRARGLLMPRIRHSTDFGNRMEIGYFIPFGDTVDTTLYADVGATSGEGINLRYRPSEDVKLGELFGYTVRDKLADRQQWKFRYQHSQDNLPGGFRGVVDVEDFSNIDFFRRYDTDPRVHTLSQIYSSAYVTKNRPTYSFNILTDRRDIFSGLSIDPRVGPPRQRFEQLPSLQFRMYPNRLFGLPFYFSLESSASHLLTSGLTNGPEANYMRADFFPTMSMQVPAPPWLSIRPQISARETYYSQSLDPATASNPFGKQLAVDDAISRFYSQAQVEVVGPSFSKVVNRSLGDFTKFKHVIEPRFRYNYTTGVNDQDRVIRFDTIDTPFPAVVQNSVEYSLTQRIIGRERGASSSSREILSFSLRQSVALSEHFNASTGGSSTTPPDDSRFTPLQASVHVNPYQSITFDANAQYGNTTHQLDHASVSANLVGTGTRADKYLSFTWFASYRDPRSSFDTSGSQLRLNTGSSLLRDRVRADVQLNYDAKTGEFLEQRFLLGGNASCYGLAFEWRRFQNFVPKLHFQIGYGLAITLKNIGTIATH
jgi:LPS-assembly protein